MRRMQLSLLLVALALLWCTPSVAGERAVFVNYRVHIQYLSSQEGRFVSEISADLSAWTDAVGVISAAAGSRLWSVTFFASQDSDGSGDTRVFDRVRLDDQQASQAYVPGGLIKFIIPTKVDMDVELSGYRFVCLRTEKSVNANPDFDFVFGSNDFANGCAEIRFDSVPLATAPGSDGIVTGDQAIFDAYKVNFQFLTSEEGRFVNEISANLSAVADAGGVIQAAAGSRLWEAFFFASDNADGSGDSFVFDRVRLGDEQASQGYVPGRVIRFTIPTSVDMDVELSGYRFVCLRTQKATNANPDFDFVFGTTDFASVCREIPFDSVPFPAVPPGTPAPDKIVIGPKQAIVESQVLRLQLSRSNPANPILGITANHTIQFDDTSAAVPGGPWQLRLFVSGNEDGSGRLEEISTQLLDDAQAYLPVNPGDTIQFSGSISFNYSEFALGPGLDFPYICTTLTKDSETDGIDLSYGNANTVTQCEPLPSLKISALPRPPEYAIDQKQAIVESQVLQLQLSRSNPANPILGITADHIIQFDDTSAAVQGGPWQLRLFVSENEDGSGRQEEISSQLLDDAQAYLPVNPGDTIQFSGSISFNYSEFELGPGLDFPYICTTLTKDSETDGIDLSYGNANTVTQCEPLPSLKISALPRPPEYAIDQKQAIVESQVLQLQLSNPANPILGITADHIIQFDDTSAAVQGGPWQLRLFVSENEDGSGRQEEISSQLLDDAQAYLPVNPGDTIQFSGSISFNYSEFALGPGLDFPYICTTLTKDSETDGIDLSYGNANTVTQCEPLPSLKISALPRPPEYAIDQKQAIVESQVLQLQLSRSNPANPILGITADHIIQFDDTSAAVQGGPWQLRLFVSENEDGSGRQEEISSQLLDDAQAYLPVNPGDTIQFSGSISFNYSEFALGPGLDFPYICTTLTKDSETDGIDLSYGNANTVTQCEPLPSLKISALPRPPEYAIDQKQAIVESQVLQLQLSRSNPANPILGITADHIIQFDDTSAAVQGGPWQLRLFVSENEDGSGRQEEISSQLLDDAQAYLPVNPGDTIQFSGSISFNYSEFALGPGLDFPYICTTLTKDSETDGIDLSYGNANTVTQCEPLPSLKISALPRPPEYAIGPKQAIVESQVLQLQLSRSNPANPILGITADHIIQFDDTSAAVQGGPWQLRLFVSENEDGSGRQEEISSQLLDDAQAYLPVNPGDTIQFSGSISFNYSEFALGPGLDFPYICTTLTKDSETDGIDLSYGNANTVTQCEPLPSLKISALPRPPEYAIGPKQAIVESQVLQLQLSRSNPANPILGITADHIIQFDDTSAAVQGGPWQLRLFVSENEDGSGRQEEISSQLLDDAQAYLPVNPGDTIQFSGSTSFNYSEFALGPGLDFTYICTRLSKNSETDGIELSYGNANTVTQCESLPSLEIAAPRPPEYAIGPREAKVESQTMTVTLLESDPLTKSVDIDVINTVMFGETSAATTGGPWQLRMFVSENEDGTGLQEEVSPQVLDSPQANLRVNPGDTIRFSGSVSYDYSGLDLGPGHALRFICTTLSRDSSDGIELVYKGCNTGTQCEPLPSLYSTPPAAIVKSQTLEVSLHRSNPELQVVDFDVLNTLVFDGSSTVVSGESPGWQLRVYVSQNEDGSGLQREVTPQLLNHVQSTMNANPGETVRFTGSHEFDFTGLNLGPGSDYPYICTTLTKDATTDDIDLLYKGSNTLTQCQGLPTLSPSPIIEGDARTCYLWGDPHTKTFDGYGYTHQGDYEYIAVTTCHNEDESLPDFEIVVDNFRRRLSKPITYIRQHRLYYNSVVYALTHPDEASVDGVKVTLPYTDSENGVTIRYSPPHKILTTDFGLVIRFDNDHNSDITLPVSYQNKVCGLCGNFDGERSNECQFRNGTLMRQHNEKCKISHTIEWTYHTPETPPPLIPEDFKPLPRACEKGMLEEARHHCGVLTDKSGPLAVCHDYADPGAYYDSCVYDLCQLLPITSFLCGSVESYVYDCFRMGNWEVDIGDWRVVTECEPHCPAGMEFSKLGNACPPTCSNPEGSPDSCPFPNLEVCQCPEADGTLLDGAKCVLPEDCGCVMPSSGRYLSVGEEFVNEDCSEQCTCYGNGDLRCTSMECTENATCGTKSGVRNCYCNDGYLGDGRSSCNTTGKVCHIYGDPHFHTFDNDWYSFQGDCTYTAVKTCKRLPKDFPHFRVMIHNDALVPEERWTYLTMVRLQVGGKMYRLKHTGSIVVDDTEIAQTLPYDDGEVQISRDGKDIMMVTSFGVKIAYDGENDARIEIPEEYFGKVCGLCGNADGDMENDKQKPDGTIAKKKDFANSWGVEGCPPAEIVQTCVPGTKDYDKAMDICSELIREDGPFAHCHGFKKPDVFFKSCIYDMCGTLPATDLFCSSATEYVKACEEKGGGASPDWEKGVKYCGTPACTDGYTSYKQSCYKFVSEPANYEDARSACEGEGGHLATVNSRGENEFVGSLAETERSWIGAIRDRSASFSTFTSDAKSPYTFLPGRLPRGRGSFRFSVQTHSGAHILLSTTDDIDEETPVYEIVLGADRNKRNFLRRCQICEPKVEQFQSYLNKRRPRDFFVNFHEGRIQVGDMESREVILDFSDRLPMRVRHIAFKTVGRTGTWKFYETEYMWVTEEPWTYDNWRFGEPSNFHSEEYCVETNYMRLGIWNDHFCALEKPFVCEIDG